MLITHAPTHSLMRSNPGLSAEGRVAPLGIMTTSSGRHTPRQWARCMVITMVGLNTTDPEKIKAFDAMAHHMVEALEPFFVKACNAQPVDVQAALEALVATAEHTPETWRMTLRNPEIRLHLKQMLATAFNTAGKE
jgi:hypothetical protein